jgi:hypothetical protein
MRFTKWVTDRLSRKFSGTETPPPNLDALVRRASEDPATVHRSVQEDIKNKSGRMRRTILGFRGRQ